MKKLILTSALALTLTSPAYAAPHAHSDLTPLGIMGDHVHAKGKWMAAYKFGTMSMKGNRAGDNEVSPQDVLQDFMVTPLDMRTNMHMFSAMYGISNKLTIMGMLPYVDKTMDHVTRMGGEFTTNTNGLGDTKLVGIFAAHNNHNMKDHSHSAVNVSFGASLPTGSITERGTTPMGYVKLPYPMQLGSGTIDPILGVTGTISQNGFSLGAQGQYIARFGKNDEGYRLGDEFSVSAWGAKKLGNGFSASLRFEGKAWGDISGADGDLNANVIPTARTDLRGGNRWDGLVGVNYTPESGKLKNTKFAVEFGVPLYQDLDGPQLQNDHRLLVGIERRF